MQSATRFTVATFGVVAGLAGIEHGIGEMLQGNTAPAGMVIESWAESELFRILGGEPAMTIVPNLLVTGVLAIIVSLAFMVWAVAFVHKRNGGLVLMVLSVALLLVGGGFGPPLLGIILGIAGTGIGAPLTSRRAPRAVAAMWAWSLAVSLAAWLALFPGALIIGQLFPESGESVVIILVLAAFGTLLSTIALGFARDSRIQIGSRKALATSRSGDQGADREAA